MLSMRRTGLNETRSGLLHQPGYEAQAVLHQQHRPVVDSTCPRGEEALVDGKDLGDVDYRVFRQPALRCRKEQVAGLVCEPEVCRQRHTDDRPEATPVEVVCLDDQEWPAETWFCSHWCKGLGPPDLAAPHHHSSGKSDRTCNSISAGSRLLGSWSYIAFRRSVTRS